MEASAVKLVSRLTNSEGLFLGHGGDLPGSTTEGAEEAAEAGARVGQVARHRLEVAQQRDELLDRHVQVLTTAREAAPEPVERVARSQPRLLVEHAERIVRLHDLRLPASATGSSRPAWCRPSPGVGLDVLQAERGARPHEQRGVGGQRLDVLVELHRHLGVGGAVLLLARLDVRDEADAGAADPRTSKPSTSCEAFGRFALRSYVGTKGRPEFAL